MATLRKPKAEAKPPEIELHPDAWERFTEFVKRIAKAGPQHRPSKREKPAASQRKAKDRS